ncbi:hypothetical protein ACLOJK_041161 [Asimina triloba]
MEDRQASLRLIVFKVRLAETGHPICHKRAFTWRDGVDGDQHRFDRFDSNFFYCNMQGPADSDAAGVCREEHPKLRRHLKSLNKPALKSIKTVYGDVFDCVDIYKQPAFDHPLLKDHKIQMWPTSFPKRLESMRNTSSEMEVKVELPDRGCPQGTVPIRRIRMRDLLSVDLSKLNKAGVRASRSGHHWVSIDTKEGGEYYGARAQMNVWKPWVGEDEFSLGQFWIVGGNPGNYNTVEAGWANDDYSNTGCYNTLCPGFVQVSRDIAPGTAARVSTYNGQQWHLTLQAFKDVRTKNWWVVFGNVNNEKPLGYFPKSLFKSLADRATSVRWGGEVFSPPNVRQPQMGSGRFPNGGYGKAAFMKMIMTVDDQNTLRDAPSDTHTVIDEPNCYTTDNANQFGNDDWRRYFYFGGPGC